MKGYFEKMKKFVLAFGIPVLAVASLIGSGYATWYFNSGDVTDNNDIALDLKEKRVAGAMFQQYLEKDTEGKTKNVKLVLDQPLPNESDGMPNDRTGVHFEGTFKESLVADVDGKPSTPDKFVSGTSYTVTTTITIPSAVAKYVKFSFNGLNSATDGLILKKEFTKAVDDTLSTFDVFDISDVTVDYTAEKPSTSDEYDAMVRDLAGKPVISISFAARIAVNTVSE